MLGLKRKPEHQLTRSTSFQCLDSPKDHPMDAIYQLGSMLWSWCKSVITQETVEAPQDSTTVSQPTPENYESFSETNYHGVSHKRQKLCTAEAALTRSKSMTNLRLKRDNNVIDVSKCDKNEARKKIDQFWEPKPLPWMVQSLRIHQQSPTPESQIVQKSDQESSQDSIQELSQESIQKLISEAPLVRRFSDPANFRGKFEHHPLKLSSQRAQVYKSHLTYRDHLKEHFEKSQGILADDTSGPLALSEYKLAQNRLRANERKERERQEAIERAKQRRLRRSFPHQRLVHKLNPFWEERVIKAHSTWGEDVLTTSIGGTELRIKDFKTLLDRKSWLNDEIINAYIEWIVDAANRADREEAVSLGMKPSSIPKFIAHNSFFFETLRKRGPASLDRLMKRKGAPGKSLLAVDSVFIPICNGLHWTLGVVRPIAKTIEYFDSMGGNPSLFISLVQNWLNHQLAEAYSPREWIFPNTACAHQSNGYDCGVFVCTNAFCVAVGLDTSCYEEADMTPQRKNIAAVLLNRGFSGDFSWKVQEDGLSY